METESHSEMEESYDEFHDLAFDDTFSTVEFLERGTEPPFWKDLFQHNTEYFGLVDPTDRHLPLEIKRYTPENDDNQNQSCDNSDEVGHSDGLHPSDLGVADDNELSNHSPVTPTHESDIAPDPNTPSSSLDEDAFIDTEESRNPSGLVAPSEAVDTNTPEDDEAVELAAALEEGNDWCWCDYPRGAM